MTATIRGIKNCMEAKKVASRWKYQSMQLHFEEECFEQDLQVYSIYMPINIYPIILANLARKVWLNYSEVTLNFVTVHVFLITEAKISMNPSKILWRSSVFGRTPGKGTKNKLLHWCIYKVLPNLYKLHVKVFEVRWRAFF